MAVGKPRDCKVTPLLFLVKITQQDWAADGVSLLLWLLVRLCQRSSRPKLTQGSAPPARGRFKAFPSVAPHRLFPLNRHHWIAEEALLSMITTFLPRVYNPIKSSGIHRRALRLHSFYQLPETLGFVPKGMKGAF